MILSMMEVDIRYRTELKGRYNALVYECPWCDHVMTEGTVCNTVGFAESHGSYLAVIQCDSCFEYFYFHASEAYYQSLIASVSLGLSKHFSKQEKT